MSFCFSDQVVDSDRPEGSRFRLTGKGVDQEPKGIFRINENTGSVSVTRTLDREAIATYQVSVPQVPTLAVDVVLFQDFCLPTELVISVLQRTRHCAARVCLSGSRVALNPNRVTGGPLSHQQSLQASVRLGALEPKKGDAWEISEEVRTVRAALAFQKLAQL